MRQRIIGLVAGGEPAAIGGLTLGASFLANTPWYRDGLRFECTACGDCCTGAPGYVWVDDEEIAALAEVMAMEVVDFERRFVRTVDGGKSLVEHADGDCVFLDPQSRRCRVYAVRPVQCRSWPFWDSNLASQRAWEATCRVCPGSGRGRLYSLQEIEIERKSRAL